MVQELGGSYPPQDTGLLHHIWHALGRLEEGQKLNRQSAEERTESLRLHVDSRIDDLNKSLGGRIDRLESRHPPMTWWKDLPWRHMIAFVIGGWLLVHGHITAPEIKGLFLKYLGLS